MKSILRKAALLAGCAAGLASGCVSTCGTCGTAGGPCGIGPGPNVSNQELYDPCWYERYGSTARRAVNHATAPQVLNGHVLDQTVWNHDFEAGTDKLTPGGLAHLQVISRRRPCSDPSVYIAFAHDLPYDPACPERYAGAVQELNTLRASAVHKYLAALNVGRAQEFTVLVHDPADPGVAAPGIANSVQQLYARHRGGLPTQAGGGGGAGGSGSGTAGGSGGGR
jgi:hypothetical protein